MFDPVGLKQLRKSCRCVLFSSITMEYQIFRPPSSLICVPECGGNQIRALVSRYSVSYDLTRKQIQDDTEINPIVVDFKVRNVADPYLIGMRSRKVPFHQILFHGALNLFILLFGICSNASQIQFPHDS